jgi:hypothetical protein
MPEYKIDRLTYFRLLSGDEIVGVVSAINNTKNDGLKVSIYRPMYIKLMPDMSGNKRPTLLALPYASPMLVDEQMFEFKESHILFSTDILTEELERVYDGFNEMFDGDEDETTQEEIPEQDFSDEDMIDLSIDQKKTVH